MTPQHYVARDVATGQLVADRVFVATTRVDRAVGLLKHDRLDPGEGLLISPCNGVHTCFMRFSIDVLALDKDGVVVDAVSTLKPWRMRLPKRGAFSVLELPAGTLQRTQIAIGHRISIDAAGQ